jgi:Na+-translocating ferredoxin:NAD+ oxidoreductase RNF subunit RnfB
MNIILLSILTLVLIGAVSAIILFFTSKRFQVFENPLIALVETALPSVNCGGCGFPSCHGFALACVHSDSLHNLVCTVGGKNTMEEIAYILGKTASPVIQTVAVIRCGGSCDFRPRTNKFDGISSCAVAHNLYGGETGCTWGCLGFGDCVTSCKFNAMVLNPKTLLPEIDESKCTSCNACIKACPKVIIELRNAGIRSRRIYVNCVNKDKEESIQDACGVACIGCEKCLTECAFDAITMNSKLAYIDSEKCTLCRKCVDVCPTKAIVEINFPQKKDNLIRKGELA